MAILIPTLMSARIFRCATDGVLLGPVFATWRVTAPTVAPNHLLVESDGFHANCNAGGIPLTLPVASALPRRGGELDALCGDVAAADFLQFLAKSAAESWDAACLGPLCLDGVVRGMP